MKIRLREFLGATVIATALAGLALGLFACSQYDPMLPEYNVGVVEGRVTVDGEGYSCEIRAEAMDDAFHNATLATGADSDGWYLMELPAGLYKVAPDLDRGNSVSKGDTLRIRPQETLRKDFSLSSLSVDALFPPELEGLTGSLELSGIYWAYGTRDTILNGRLHIDFPALRPAPYQVHLSVDECQKVHLPDPDFAGETRDSLRVDPGAPAFLDLDFSASTATLKGRVSGPWQGGADFVIKAYRPDSTFIYSGKCSETGDFQLTFLVPQPIVLQTEQGSISRWYGGASCAAATHFAMEPGDRITDVTLSTSSLSLNLRGPGERLFYDSIVILRRESGIKESFHFCGTPPYVLGNLGAGRYFVQINGFRSREPWAAQWYSAAESLAAATPIDLASDELRILDFPLETGGTISGQVFYSDGLVLREVRCAIFDSDGLPMYGGDNPDWISFDDGIFSFVGLPDGDVYLAAGISNSNVTWYPGTREFADAQPVTIHGHGSVQDITWNLKVGEKGRP